MIAFFFQSELIFICAHSFFLSFFGQQKSVSVISGVRSLFHCSCFLPIPLSFVMHPPFDFLVILVRGRPLANR